MRLGVCCIFKICNHKKKVHFAFNFAFALPKPVFQEFHDIGLQEPFLVISPRFLHEMTWNLSLTRHFCILMHSLAFGNLFHAKNVLFQPHLEPRFGQITQIWTFESHILALIEVVLAFQSIYILLKNTFLPLYVKKTLFHTCYESRFC